MALLHTDFFSNVLGMCVQMDVILPQRTTGQIGMEGKTRLGKYPTLYLLHGLSDDHTIWQRRTSIERYVADLGIAVVMPCTHRAWYTDTATGMKYWTYISEELPAICRDFFPNMSDNVFKRTVNELSYMLRTHVGYYPQNDWYGLKKTVGQMLLLTAILSPMLVLLYSVLHRKRKAAKGQFLPRFTYFCMMALYPVSALAIIPISSDSVRWIAQGFLVLFSLVLYMIYKEKEAILDIIAEKAAHIPPPAAALYYGIWFFTVLNPYV